MNLPINWEYLDKRFEEENTNKSEVSRLLGYSKSYLSMRKKQFGGLEKAEIDKLRDLMDIDMKQLVPRDTDKDEGKASDVDRTEAFTIGVLIAEIGELRGEVEALKKKVEEPTIVAIPMDAKEMAIRVVGELLEGGWCTKGEVLIKFNEHHIPIQYINDAIHAHGAVMATAGHGTSMRTFIIKEGKNAV